MTKLNVDKAKLTKGLNALACGLNPDPEFIGEYYKLIEARLESKWFYRIQVEREVLDECFNHLLSEEKLNDFARLWVPSKKASSFAFLTTSVDMVVKETLKSRAQEFTLFAGALKALQDTGMVTSEAETRYIKQGDYE